MKFEFNYRLESLTLMVEANIAPSILPGLKTVTNVKIIGCVGSCEDFNRFMKAFDHNEAILKDEAIVQFNAWKRLNDAILTS